MLRYASLAKGIAPRLWRDRVQSLVPPHWCSVAQACIVTYHIYLCRRIGPESARLPRACGQISLLTGRFRFVAAAGIGASNIWARLSLRAARCLCSTSRWVHRVRQQFDPITYIHPDLPVGGPDRSTNESKIRRRRSQPQRSKLYRKARPLPDFLSTPIRTCSGVHRRDRHAAPLSSQPALGPPDDRDARTKWSHLPSTGVARSIQILVAPENLPILDWLKINQSLS